EGATFERVVDHYLDSFDPARVKPGTRRCAPTATVDSRYVPAEVRREVAARTEGRCAVPFCDHEVFLEFAHVVPHAAGGDREARNGLGLCHGHHVLYDRGLLRVEGPSDAPRFFDVEGRDLS